MDTSTRTTYVVTIHFCLCILISASSAARPFLATETLDDPTVVERAGVLHPFTHPDVPPRQSCLCCLLLTTQRRCRGPWTHQKSSCPRPIVCLPSDHMGICPASRGARPGAIPRRYSLILFALLFLPRHHRWLGVFPGCKASVYTHGRQHFFTVFHGMGLGLQLHVT
jgi:hypothetical protein